MQIIHNQTNNEEVRNGVLYLKIGRWTESSPILCMKKYRLWEEKILVNVTTTISRRKYNN